MAFDFLSGAKIRAQLFILQLLADGQRRQAQAHQLPLLDFVFESCFFYTVVLQQPWHFRRDNALRGPYQARLECSIDYACAQAEP